jgi:hypothetical protein
MVGKVDGGQDLSFGGERYSANTLPLHFLVLPHAHIGHLYHDSLLSFCFYFTGRLAHNLLHISSRIVCDIPVQLYSHHAVLI